MLEDLMRGSVVFIKTDSRIIEIFLERGERAIMLSIHYQSSMLDLDEK